MLNRFDMNLLAALDALLHEKNVTRAAQRVHVSQPTMSAAFPVAITLPAARGTATTARRFNRPLTGEST